MRIPISIITAWMMIVPGMAEARQTRPWETLPVQESLPKLTSQGLVPRSDASIWFATLGAGEPVILLHGGLASSDAWGNQIGALIASHHRVILVDSRGHGRSTLGNEPLGYERMEADVIGVMDALRIEKAAVVGWSDGAIIGLVMAMKDPERVTKVYAFGANMDVGALTPGTVPQNISRKLSARMSNDYKRLSQTPDAFGRLVQQVRAMQNDQPRYGTSDLRSIQGPRVAIVDGDHEEFIAHAHTAYLARTIPKAELIILKGVSHFAPWQNPKGFNTSMIAFLDR